MEEYQNWDKIVLDYGKCKVLMVKFGITYPTVRNYLRKTKGEIKNPKFAAIVREYAIKHLKGRLIPTAQTVPDNTDTVLKSINI